MTSKESLNIARVQSELTKVLKKMFDFVDLNCKQGDIGTFSADELMGLINKARNELNKLEY